jgi:hypothetical protein
LSLCHGQRHWVLTVSLLRRRAPDLLSRPRPAYRPGPWFTHPAVPLALFTGALVAGGLLTSEVLVWGAFGALAGFALSGST